MERRVERQLLEDMHYPLFRITPEWQGFYFACHPYVCYSLIKGYTPCIDIILDRGGSGRLDSPHRTMVINQTSLGKAMRPFFTGERDPMDLDYRIRKVDSGKFAAIELEECAAPRVEPTPPVDYAESDDEEGEDE